MQLYYLANVSYTQLEELVTILSKYCVYKLLNVYFIILFKIVKYSSYIIKSSK